MGDTITAPDELALAVSGLAGLIGFLALPALGAWLRIAFAWIDAEQSGLGKPSRPSWYAYGGAVALSALWVFFLASHLRAAGQLREVRLEAPVVGTTLTGVVVGLAFWLLVAVCWGALQRDAQRAQQSRRQHRLPLS